MDKTIIAFLRKEPMATKSSNTDGRKLFYKDTCVGQWEDHHVIVSNTEYKGEKEMNAYIGRLQKWTINSDIIYKLCTKVVPFEAKQLLPYK